MIRTPIAILLATALASVAAIGSAVPLRAQVDGPNLPELQPVTLEPSTTALLVLDLSTRCDDPQQVCRELVPRIRDLLARVRGANVFTVFSVSSAARGTPLGETWGGFARRPDEPLIYPDGYDSSWAGSSTAYWKSAGLPPLSSRAARATSRCSIPPPPPLASITTGSSSPPTG